MPGGNDERRVVERHENRPPELGVGEELREVLERHELQPAEDVERIGGNLVERQIERIEDGEDQEYREDDKKRREKRVRGDRVARQRGSAARARVRTGPVRSIVFRFLTRAVVTLHRR